MKNFTPMIGNIPAAKAFSLPVITMAPTASSFSRLFTAFANSVIKPSQRAFRTFGLFRVTKPTFCLDPTLLLRMYSYLFSKI